METKKNSKPMESQLPLTVRFLDMNITLPSEWRDVRSLWAFSSLFSDRYTKYSMECEFWCGDELLTEMSDLPRILQKPLKLECFPKYICNEGYHGYIYFTARKIDFKNDIYTSRGFTDLKERLWTNLRKPIEFPKDKLEFFKEYVDVSEASPSYSLWFVIRTLFNIALDPKKLNMVEIEATKHFLLEYKDVSVLISCIKDPDSENAVMENFNAMIKSGERNIMYGIIVDNEKWVLTCFDQTHSRKKWWHFLVSYPITLSKKEGKFSDTSVDTMICTIQMLTNDNALDITQKYLKELQRLEP